MTELMLLWPMVAMPASDVTRAVAERKLLLSAAACDARLSWRSGRFLFVDQLDTDIASWYNFWMSPVRMSRSLVAMAMLMLSPSRSPLAVGANINISMWKSSHQNGAGDADEGAKAWPPRRSWHVVVSTMARMMAVRTVKYSALFLALANPRQVERNSGGSCT